MTSEYATSRPLSHFLHANPFAEQTSASISCIAAVGLLLFHLLCVRLLRYRRRDGLLSKAQYRDRALWKCMSLQDAHHILLSLAELEFPTIFATSIFFAIFKTYGIPSISSLLVATGQLADDTTASKRAADTGILITEFVLNEPESARAVDGIVRVNYLHDRYRKAGKISDDDMLYTLSVFALEPVRWTERYEWRALTGLERCAMGVFWKDVGDMMDIPYHRLSGSESGWEDGLHWLEDLQQWSAQYEAKHMVPARSNAKLAGSTFDIALHNVPIRLRPLCKQVATVLIEPRLRSAMMLQRPPAILQRLFGQLFELRKLMLQHLALPRPYFLRNRWFTDQPDPRTGCIHALQYISHPWYIKPTFQWRWGPKSWLLWLVGGAIPRQERSEYHPEGYKICQMGPEALRNKGKVEMEKSRAFILTRRHKESNQPKFGPKKPTV